MKRFDPIAAMFGVFFMLAGAYFLDGKRSPSFSDIGLVVPFVMIALGLSVIMKNRSR